MNLLHPLVTIFYTIVLPMLLLAGIGAALHRMVGLDMATLTRLNFHFVIPAMIYYALVSSRLTLAEAGTAVGFSVALMASMTVLTRLAAAVRGVPRDQRSALTMTTIFFNAGNYGLPLQDLTFAPSGLSNAAMSLQSLVMITQNIASFTFGMFLAAGGRGGREWRQNLLLIVKFPPIYALVAGLVTLQIRSLLGEPGATAAAQAIAPFWNVVTYVKNAFIAVALLTLGAQLAAVGHVAQRYPVKLSVFLRLLVGPAMGLALIYALGLRGLVAQALLISTSTPTAVNALLLCMEFDNHPQYVARAVLYSTLLSPITVTAVIFLSLGDLLPGFADGARPAATQANNPHPRKDTPMTRATSVSIEGPRFCVNGTPTHPGRTWRGMTIEGLLLNSRMVQGIFDDRNARTRPMWDYADGPWDAARNTREFLAAMPQWRTHGLDAFTLNLQGGSPQGYSSAQPWHNSAFESDGSLLPDYLLRLERIVDRADELGMGVILGYFYFGQDERIADEAAVIRAADNATDWLLEKGYTHVLVEIDNEADVPMYEHPILQPARVHELIARVKDRSAGRVNTPAGRLLVSTSMSGGKIPPGNIVQTSDFVLLHGNGVNGRDGIRTMVDTCRGLAEYRGQPIVFNEDDHFEFDRDDNHMLAAIERYAGWGYFDYRKAGEGFDEGYQSVPVNWGISSARKRGFFDLLARLTGTGIEDGS